MQANQKASVTEGTKQAVLPSDLDVIEKDIQSHRSLSKDDVKFVGELGWLSAAAVLIAGVAANL